MKVGDLVKYASPEITGNFVGLIVEVGAWSANCDIKVLWCHEKVAVTQASYHVKVINESR